MEKVAIPDGLVGKDLTCFVTEHKKALLAQKREMAIKYCDPFFGTTLREGMLGNGGEAEKAFFKTPLDGKRDLSGTVRVKAVANTAYWIDSQRDVLMPGCWGKSIKDRQGMIPHIHDHIHSIMSHIGDVAGIYSEQSPWSALGIDKAGYTETLVFETDIRRDYNEKAFAMYRAGKVTQHSIGMQYISIALAVDDEHDKEGKALYDEVLPLLGNPDEANGYFFVVKEIRLLENSAVLFGSNPLTPTLHMEGQGTPTEPPQGTPTEPQDAFDWKGYIEGKTFLN